MRPPFLSRTIYPIADPNDVAGLVLSTREETGLWRSGVCGESPPTGMLAMLQAFVPREAFLAVELNTHPDWGKVAVCRWLPRPDASRNCDKGYPNCA
jgi:hypothetical protein